jgi:SAM-dependent methyltransferase
MPTMFFYIPTIFLSAFLLFLIQPIIAKQILPWFGGSASVWTTALVFFQVTLLAGYAYCDATTRFVGRRVQAFTHIGLLIVSLVFLPVMADSAWKPLGDENPSLRIIGLLLVTIGLPFFLLSSTGPLVQSWFARSFAERRVYRLFALSNLASLLGLVSYPFAIEPWITMQHQVWIWSAGYAVYVISCTGAALFGLYGRTGTTETGAARAQPDRPDPAFALAPEAPPSLGRMATWVMLSALGSLLLLATTNHITRDIASIPFLWVLPLSLYLLTFVLCFDSDFWYRRWLFLPLTALFLIACAWGLQASAITYNINILLPLYVAGMFVLCMFAHGELAADRPAPAYLTRFYLMVSLGGALGGLFVGLIAPYIFPDNFETGLGYVALALLAILVLRKEGVVVMGAAAGVAIACAVFYGMQIHSEIAGNRVLMRNFYTTLQTHDTQPDAVTGSGTRVLIDGVIIHGEQYLEEPWRSRPVTYYGVNSGIGRVMDVKREGPRKVAVVGLGAGTMAAFGKDGDHYRFYEINPQMVWVAENEFSYLRDSKAAISIAMGDARLSLEREDSHNFDVMLIDAFSSDSVPMHLMSAEAMEVYLKHLAPDGVIVFNVTNRYLNLAPPIQLIAREYGLVSIYISDEPTDRIHYDSEFVLVSRDPSMLANPRIASGATRIDEIPNLGIWTDNYNNLFRILR